MAPVAPLKSPNTSISISGTVDVEHRTRIHDRVTPLPTSPFESDMPIRASARNSLRVDGAIHQYESEETPRWRARIEQKLPKSIVWIEYVVLNWIKGPDLPTKHRITPLFEHWQTLPNSLLGRLPKWLRIAIHGAACLLWAVGFGVIVNDYSLPKNIGSAGPPVRLSCVDNLWYVSDMRRSKQHVF